MQICVSYNLHISWRPIIFWSCQIIFYTICFDFWFKRCVVKINYIMWAPNSRLFWSKKQIRNSKLTSRAGLVFFLLVSSYPFTFHYRFAPLLKATLLYSFHPLACFCKLCFAQSNICIPGAIYNQNNLLLIGPFGQ